jgi:hypothetical protein
MQGAALVEFNNQHFGVIAPTQNGTYDWLGKLKLTGTDMTSGSATLI